MCKNMGNKDTKKGENGYELSGIGKKQRNEVRRNDL